jgi:hypothetical protein
MWSKLGRQELDTAVFNDGAIVDDRQVSFEAMWWIIRRFCNAGVVSLWDSVGTTTVTALWAGRHAIGIEPRSLHHRMACSRIATFKKHSALVVAYNNGDTEAGVYRHSVIGCTGSVCL